MLNASHVRTKRAAFDDESMSSTPASACGWLPTMPTDAAAEPREAADDVLGEARLQLEERALVDDGLDHALDVVRLRRLVGDELVELGRLAVDRIGRLVERRRLTVVLRQEAEQVARVLERGLLVVARSGARRPTWSRARRRRRAPRA